MRITSIFTLSLCLLMTACSHMTPDVGAPTQNDGAPKGNVDVTQIPDAVPKAEPRSRYGNPSAYKVHGKTYKVMNTTQGYHAKGLASWYGTKFHNQRTSSGEPYNMFAMTAAHKSLPIPSYLKVRNLVNGREVIVKVNDRGPFHDNRLIDLSYVAAKKLGITGNGTGLVEVKSIDTGTLPSMPSMPSFQRMGTSKLASKHNNTQNHVYLQLGAFANQANAAQFAKKIHELTKQPIRLATGAGARPIYKVQVGPLAGSGDNIYQQIKSAGLGNAVRIFE
jgi:rare lipoprotein A